MAPIAPRSGSFGARLSGTAEAIDEEERDVEVRVEQDRHARRGPPGASLTRIPRAPAPATTCALVTT